jgi:hypothetical protein
MDYSDFSNLAFHAVLDIRDVLDGRRPEGELKELCELDRRYKEFFPYNKHNSFEGVTLFVDVLATRDPLFQDPYRTSKRLTISPVKLRQGLFHQKLKRVVSLLEAKALWPNITPTNSFESKNLEDVHKFLLDLAGVASDYSLREAIAQQSSCSL